VDGSTRFELALRRTVHRCHLSSACASCEERPGGSR